MTDFRNDTHNFIACYTGHTRNVFIFEGKSYVKWGRVPRKGSFENITIMIAYEKADCKETITKECERIAQGVFPSHCYMFKTTTKFQENYEELEWIKS